MSLGFTYVDFPTSDRKYILKFARVMDTYKLLSLLSIWCDIINIYIIFKVLWVLLVIYTGIYMYGSICIGYVQLLGHFISEIWA